jgi:putative flippase GtrA
MKRFFDKSMYRFLIIGSINTVLGIALMFVFYNVFHLGYWGSTAIAYIIGSVFSYLMNKNYTFSYKKKDKMSILRFISVQVVAYSIAYLIARPLVFFVFGYFDDYLNLEFRYIEQLAMLVGMGFFIVLGYMGQRFFAFRKKNEEDAVL